MYIIMLTDKDVLNIDNEIQCKLKFKLQYEHLLYSQRRSLMEKQCLYTGPVSVLPYAQTRSRDVGVKPPLLPANWKLH